MLVGHLVDLGPRHSWLLRYHARNESPIDLHAKMATYHVYFQILTTIQEICVIYQNKGDLIDFY